MVRYARAKGSKASNEKLPEDATPWQVMKKQMIDAQQPKVEPLHNINDFLKKDSTNEDRTTWAVFEQPEKQAGKKKNKKGKLPFEAKSVLQKKRKRKNCPSEDNKSGFEVDEMSTTPPLKKIKKEKIKQKTTEDKECLGIQKPSKGPELDFPVHEFGAKPIAQSKFKRNEKSKRFGNKDFGGKPKFMSRNKIQDHLRRKPKRDSFIVRFGSKEVELRYFDGFPVKAEDWQRLNELRNKMKENNIPEEQIQATLKLQRRRAEKALTNERKKVCFVCREPGHVLSECPSVGEAPMGKNKDSSVPDSKTSGMCYKCGSLEHTHFDCKVVQEAAYRFAKCFVCGEQGHISRQCPDNPRGLYPKGGGCSECGDVTHFRKDCPTHQKEKEDAALTVHTLKQEDALEALDGDSNQKIRQLQKASKKTKKKVVKF